jgi:hypothetical protein
VQFLQILSLLMKRTRMELCVCHTQDYAATLRCTDDSDVPLAKAVFNGRRSHEKLPWSSSSWETQQTKRIKCCSVMTLVASHPRNVVGLRYRMLTSGTGTLFLLLQYYNFTVGTLNNARGQQRRCFVAVGYCRIRRVIHSISPYIVQSCYL